MTTKYKTGMNAGSFRIGHGITDTFNNIEMSTDNIVHISNNLSVASSIYTPYIDGISATYTNAYISNLTYDSGTVATGSFTDLVVTGNLTVRGDSSFQNVNELTIEDPSIKLGYADAVGISQVTSDITSNPHKVTFTTIEDHTYSPGDYLIMCNVTTTNATDISSQVVLVDSTSSKKFSILNTSSAGSGSYSVNSSNTIAGKVQSVDAVSGGGFDLMARNGLNTAIRSFKYIDGSTGSKYWNSNIGINITNDDGNEFANYSIGGTSFLSNQQIGNNSILLTGYLDNITANNSNLNIDATTDLSLNSSEGIINIGNDSVNQNINIATSGTRTLTIGTTSTGLDINSSTTTIDAETNITLTAGSIVDINASTLTITATNGIEFNGGDNPVIEAIGSLDIDAITDLSLNSSEGIINIGNDSVNQNVNIATGGTRTLTIGNPNTTLKIITEAGTHITSNGYHETTGIHKFNNGLSLGDEQLRDNFIDINHETGSIVATKSLNQKHFKFEKITTIQVSTSADFTLLDTIEMPTDSIGIITTDILCSNFASSYKFFAERSSEVSFYIGNTFKSDGLHEITIHGNTQVELYGKQLASPSGENWIVSTSVLRMYNTSGNYIGNLQIN